MLARFCLPFLAAFACCSAPPAVPRGDAEWVARLRTMSDYGDQIRAAEAAWREADAADSQQHQFFGRRFDHEAARGRLVATLGDLVALEPDPSFAPPERGLFVAVYDEDGFKACVCCVEIVVGCALGQVAFDRPGSTVLPGDRFTANTRQSFWPEVR